MNCFYLSAFYSILTFLHFYMIINFDSHYHPSYCRYFRDYCCYYYFCNFHYYFFTFNAFNFISPFFITLFYTFVYIEYFKILNIWVTQTVFKVDDKDTETISGSLLWTLNSICLIYSSDDLLNWYYYILLLIIISFIL